MKRSSAILVEQARAGDVAAFSALVREYQDVVMGTAYGWLGDLESARDVSQEAFLDAWVHLVELREAEAFPGWLRRIVHKHCDRLTRRAQPVTVPLAESVAAPESAADVDERPLRLSIQALPVNERLVVALGYFADLSGPELAEFLELPLSTVKKRLRSARARLRDEGDRLMEKTVERIRPSVTGEFAEAVTFFLAIRAGDRARVRDMLARSPALVDAVQEWEPGLVTDGVLPFASRATALITAIERDDRLLLELLLDAGAAVDGRCGCLTGESPVWAATVLDRVRHLEILLEHGADAGQRSATGNVPLHVAAMRGQTAAVRLLLAHGADPRARDAHDRTPAEWARINGHRAVAALLKDVGAAAVTDEAAAVKPRLGDAAAPRVWFTGIKALDLFCPIPLGGIVRVPFMAGVGMVVLFGELCRRMTMSPRGRALWSGFSQRPFDFKDWQTEMSELGLAHVAEQSLADVHAGTDRRRGAFHGGLDRARAMAADGLDVLLVLTSDPEFESDIEAALPRLADVPGPGSVTTLIATPFPQSDEATWSALQAPFSAQIKLDRQRARRRLFPALDPRACLSVALCEDVVGAEHLAVAERAKRVLLEHAARDPELGAFEAGVSDPHLAGVPPRVSRPGGGSEAAAVALIRYLVQPFFVAEPFTGLPGEWVNRDDLLEAVRPLLN